MSELRVSLRSARSSASRWCCGIAFALWGAGCSADAVEPSRMSQGVATPGGVLGVGGASSRGGPGATLPTLPPSGAQPISPLPPAGDAAGGCPKGQAHATPVSPTVWLVIDNSTSMEMELAAGISRWDALRAALMDMDGVVAALQDSVRFGLVGYSGPFPPLCDSFDHISFRCGCFTGLEDACCTEACGFVLPKDVDFCGPTLQIVQPAPTNQAAISAMYPNRPAGGWTPTDRALKYVVEQLPAQPDPAHPVYVLLATDGAPNDACGPDMGQGNGNQEVVMQRVVDATTAGTQKGMHMFIVSLAGDDAILRTHLEQVAAIGQPGKLPFVPANKQELIDNLQLVVSGATCQVTLDGTVMTGRECDGTVQLNGTALPCNSDDGWRLSDPSTVQLTGTACKSFLSTDSKVNADFPCEVFVPQ